MSRVIVLSYCYPPMNVPRAIQVSRLLAHADVPVTAVWVGDEGPGDPTVPAGADDIDVRRVPLRGVGILRRLLRRLAVPDPYLSWALRAAWRLRSTERPTPDDLLVTFGQPMSDHVAGLLLRRATGVRWIAHFSDPWVATPFTTRGRWSQAVNLRLERAVLRRADRVLFTSDQARDAVLAAHPGIEARPAVLPHAFDPAGAQTDAGGPLVARVVGSFYGVRTPAPLLAALGRSRTEDPTTAERWRVGLVGSMPPAWQEAAAAAGVDVRGHVTYGESASLMRSADLLVVVDAPGDTSVFLPSKLIEYVGAGVPILALSPPGPAADLVTRLGGWVADPSDPVAAGDALLAALRAAPSAPWPWGDPAVRSEFEADAVAARFRAVCDEVLAG